MSAYLTAYATCARSSRVAVAPRTPSAIAQVAALDHAPRMLVVAPDGGHVALDHGRAFEVRRAGDGAVTGRGDKPEGAPLTMLASTMLVDGYEVGWDGQPGTMNVQTGLEGPGRTWALSTEGACFAVVVQAPGNRWHPLPELRVSTRKFLLPERRRLLLGWIEQLDGLGCGAIGADRSVVVAMRDGAFLVFEPDAETPEGRGVRRVDTKLSLLPRDLSVVEGGYALLGEGEADDADVAALVDPAGRVAWRFKLPFAASQPPIDLGAGRIAVAGTGLVVLEGGREVYASRAPAATHVTAFTDGTLVVASGADLGVVARDGTLLAKLAIADGLVSAPPAIGPDGALWIATDRALYRAT